jgi:hypothetical protein
MKRLSAPITFEFKPFPTWKPGQVLLTSDPFRRPSIIDPRDVARTIALGKQVMAFIEDGKVYYITSRNPDYHYPGLFQGGTGLGEGDSVGSAC